MAARELGAVPPQHLPYAKRIDVRAQALAPGDHRLDTVNLEGGGKVTIASHPGRSSANVRTTEITLVNPAGETEAQLRLYMSGGHFFGGENVTTAVVQPPVEPGAPTAPDPDPQAQRRRVGSLDVVWNALHGI